MKARAYTKLLFPILLAFLSSGEIKAQTVGERINLGLYGGAAKDLTFSYSNNRLFAVVETPASLFYTDDTCQTWTQAFPLDSLQYDSGSRGWGGGGTHVLSNTQGWVAVETHEQGGTLNAAVVSYIEGDSGSFKTALDRHLMEDIVTGPPNNVTAIGLSDHFLYVGAQKYLTRQNDTSTFGNHMIVAEVDTVPGMISDPYINYLAVANDETGYPVYMVVSEGMHDDNGSLYKFDGTSVNAITSYPTGYVVEKVFTHPGQITGDTTFISCRDTVADLVGIFRTTDGGTSWTDVTPATGSYWPMHSADYSPDWVSDMPSSNGLRLSFSGGESSNDLGNTWTAHVLPDNGVTTHPQNVDLCFGSYGRGTAVSTTGPEGSFTIADNQGLAAVKISKIAESKGVYYVATNAGLGYTTAYFDTTVVGYDQWNLPYGQFPVPDVGDDGGVSAVAIDPNDSLHAVAGYSGGFCVTVNGPAYFTYVSPSGWNSAPHYDQLVTDIKFISSDTLIAVTGSKLNVSAFPGSYIGNIWRSTDGGWSWTKVTPYTPDRFLQGNCVAVGMDGTDTVLYAGTGHMSGGDSPTPGALWKSTDLGLNWTQVNVGPTDGYTTELPIYDIDIDPRSIDTLYIGAPHVFVRSDDGGSSYFYTSVPGAEGEFTSTLVKSSFPNIVYTGQRRNLYRYHSVLDIAVLVFRGMPGEFVPDLEEGSILAATNTGLYKIIEDDEGKARIQGQVTDGESGEAIEFAQVIIGENDTLLTNAAGFYFGAIGAGTYDLTYQAPGYAEASYTGIELTADEYTTLDVSLDPVPFHEIELEIGYRMVSSFMEPLDPDMLNMLEPILPAIDFVRNTQGHVLQKIGPDWVNGIGDWNTTEGYLFRMNDAVVLGIPGETTNPESPIELMEGYNISAYLLTDPLDASAAFETIMNDNLDFIRNSSGYMLRKIGPNWVNGIGNAQPGEGYLIKMLAEDILIYPLAEKRLSAHIPRNTSFFPEVNGDPTAPVFTLYIRCDETMEPGDEVAAFCNGKLVGSAVIRSDRALENALPVFSQLMHREGYEAGEPIIIKHWNKQTKEINQIDFRMSHRYEKAHKERRYPKGDGAFSIIKAQPHEEDAPVTGVSLFPNPAIDVVNIIANEPIERIMLMDMSGRMIMEKEPGASRYKLPLNDLENGVYLLSLELNNRLIRKKVVVRQY